MSGTGPVGHVDKATGGDVTGWIADFVDRGSLSIEVDGMKVPAAISFYSRPDLVEAGINGVGFHARFVQPDLPFYLRVGGGAVDGGSIDYLSCSESLPDGDPSVCYVEPTVRDIAILTGAEISELAAALDPDTTIYHDFLRRFVDVRGVAQVELDVLFIDGTYNSVSTRYRLTHIAQALQEQGYSTRSLNFASVPFSVVAGLRTRVAVFFRAPLTEDYRFVMQALRSRGTRIVFDMDDLVVDPSLIANIDGIRYLTAEDTAQYHRGIGQYRNFALAADIVTCSTSYLARYVENLLGVKTATIRNTIGRSYLQHYHIRTETPVGGRDGAFVIGYYSGSKTHQRDFAQAAGGIAKFLSRYPSAMLRIVGSLDLEEFRNLQPLRRQILSVAPMPYHEMMQDFAACDVVIAPLEVGDPFCESKSELKFFEAALRGVVCIASPTETYRSAMRDGEVGFLAQGEDAWFQALETVFLSVDTREVIAKRAGDHAREHYAYTQSGGDAKQAYFGFDAARDAPPSTGVPRPIGSDRLSIAVVIPGLVIGGGGHRKILRFCKDWATQGHTITLYVDTNQPAERVRHDVRTHFFDFDFELRIFRGFVGRHDAVICTHWSTAYALRRYADPERVFYFVQDFEPMFDPVSTNYVKALATYQMGFNVIAFGSWVADRIKIETGVTATPIDFTVDLSRYVMKETIQKSLDVLFFARPSQPRRCFELGVEALRLLHQDNSAVRIALYGENEYGELGFPYYNYGLVTNLDRLATIYNKTKVGVCFSTTNPSSVGYEMLACGAALVDLKVPGWEKNFGGDEFVYYSQPTSENVAKSIADALGDETRLKQRVAAGTSYVRRMPEDGMIGETLLSLIVRKLT